MLFRLVKLTLATFPENFIRFILESMACAKLIPFNLLASHLNGAEPKFAISTLDVTIRFPCAEDFVSVHENAPPING